jgi:enoyl-CoA hydratase/carnithine racemase
VTSSLLVTTEREVRTIAIDRPSASNALRVSDKIVLAAAIREAETDGVRAIVLRGAGDGPFCAGTDIKEMAGFDVAEGTRMLQAEAAMLDAVIRTRVPVIAAVHRHALGGGCVLAYCCDVTIADETARFAQPEIRNGVPAPVHAALLPRVVGLGRARRMIFLGEVLDARAALDAGLVSDIVESDRLYEHAQELGEAIARFPPNGVALQKEIVGGWLRYGFDAAVETSAHIAASAFAGEEPRVAISAFLERRS